MSDLTFNDDQLALLQAPLQAKIFLEGPAGCGKTSAAAARLLGMLEAGLEGESILLLAPQRTLAGPYEQVTRGPRAAAGGVVQALTVGGLARRTIDLFWPLVAEAAGFAFPGQPPIFLTLETAQYYMAHLARPLLDEGLFDSVTIDRNRLYSQILDNLNKAAVVGFPHTQIGERLASAWVGEPGQLRVYQDAQACANLFREYCLAHNLLDFSLQVEIFRQRLWEAEAPRAHLLGSYRYLIYDNLEEDTPLAHDLLREWLPHFESCLLIYDWQAGYRRFLGADPDGGYALKEFCSQEMVFERSFVVSPEAHSLSVHLAAALNRPQQPGELSIESLPPPHLAFEFAYHRFYPQMLDWVVDQIAWLVFEQGAPPGEVVVLAPFLSDALRFSLVERLGERGVPARSHRPSRSLREEPATQCLLTLSALAHPQWGLRPADFDVAYALMQAISGLDLVRAQLLAEIVYHVRDGLPTLSSFDLIRPEVQERITYRLGQRYERLRLWLEAAQETPQAFDHFLSRLFGELLSQPGYGFHASFDAGRVSANLIESVQKFRWAVGDILEAESAPLGAEYLAMVQDGVIAAQYIPGWQANTPEAVLLAPAYTFLMSNRPAYAQFWLDVGGRGWSERLYQPLTHPYVLSRDWQPGRLWSDQDELQAEQEALYRLALGLLRRCKAKLYLGLSEMNEQGYEGRGPLLQAFQRVLRQNHP
ncbi:MAG: hypothetical protein JXA78_03045 [Anaerolineales bacterium]|nr:hypothetical protein [Anaerolineales bacterium]